MLRNSLRNDGQEVLFSGAVQSGCSKLFGISQETSMIELKASQDVRDRLQILLLILSKFN